MTLPTQKYVTLRDCPEIQLSDFIQPFYECDKIKENYFLWNNIKIEFLDSL
jgi:hypothetical protein